VDREGDKDSQPAIEHGKHHRNSILMAIVEGVFLTGIGIILVSGVWLDFIATAMTASCTGVFSRRFSYGLYLIFKKGTKIFRSQRWHVAAGPFITLALIILGIRI
jgi:hypothetical protein